MPSGTGARDGADIQQVCFVFRDTDGGTILIHYLNFKRSLKGIGPNNTLKLSSTFFSADKMKRGYN